MRRSVLNLSLFLLATTPLPAALFQDDFNQPDGVITNEYAFWNPSDALAKRSAYWIMDSGSFFVQGGAGWTGVPDDVAPNRLSTNGTNSAVFRLHTQRADFLDVSVTLSLRNQGLTATPTTPAVDWDGAHLWLRYQSAYSLYYASLNRRDNTVLIKKKVPGGPSNQGTYYTISPTVAYTVPYGTVQTLQATVKNNVDGSVTIALYKDNQLLVSATDDGTVGGPPIRQAGAVGIRGDNANLKIDDFIVESLSSPVPPVPPTPPTPPITPITPEPPIPPTPPATPVTSDPAPAPPIAHVYPNPWRSDRYASESITFDQLTGQNALNIFTISGHLVRSLPVSSGQVAWDLRNTHGDPVGSGIYVFASNNPSGRGVRGKVAVVR